jgi:hypothetical protein
VPDAQQCESGGFDEFLVAMNWLVLQLGGRSTYTQNGWSKFAMDHLLAGPYFGRKWKNVLDAQCEAGGFDEFLVALNWLVLQLGGRSTYTQNGWSKFAMVDLLAGPCWPLLWARVTASAATAVFIGQDPNPDLRLDMAAALLRVLRWMWGQSFGSDFVF